MKQQHLVDDIEHVFRAAEPRLMRLTRLQGVNADNAADVVQETFIEAWRHIQQLRSPERVDAWLDGICRNVCHRYQRAQGIVSAQEIPLTTLAAVGNEDAALAGNAALEPQAFDLEAELNRQDMATLLDHALSHLPTTTRDVVALCYLAELPQVEAAARLGLTISALEARLHRARKQLRQVLNGDLRAEAEALGVTLDAAALGQWRESRDWCPVCGKSRLWGIFVTMPDGRTDFRLRCPTCAVGEILCSSGFVDFKGAHSFRPAMKRVTTAIGTFYDDALRQQKDVCCWNCHQRFHFQIVQDEIDFIALYKTWVASHCQCGQLYAAGIVACFDDPVIRGFLLESSRCVVEPDKVVTFQGAAALRFAMCDLTSGRRMLIFAHPQTLAVLATVIE